MAQDSQAAQSTEQPLIGFETMQVFGANFFRGTKSQDGGIVLEFGVSSTGPAHADTKMVCSVAMTEINGSRLIAMLQQLLSGQIPG